MTGSVWCSPSVQLPTLCCQGYPLDCSTRCHDDSYGASFVINRQWHCWQKAFWGCVSKETHLGCKAQGISAVP